MEGRRSEGPAWAGRPGAAVWMGVALRKVCHADPERQVRPFLRAWRAPHLRVTSGVSALPHVLSMQLLLLLLQGQQRAIQPALRIPAAATSCSPECFSS